LLSKGIRKKSRRSEPAADELDGRFRRPSPLRAGTLSASPVLSPGRVDRCAAKPDGMFRVSGSSFGLSRSLPLMKRAGAAYESARCAQERPISVSSAERQRLEALVKDRNARQKHVWRAAIVLFTVDRAGTNEINATNRQVEDLRLALTGTLHGRGVRGPPSRQDATLTDRAARERSGRNGLLR
jgi:hypothetical protein